LRSAASWFEFCGDSFSALIILARVLPPFVEMISHFSSDFIVRLLLIMLLSCGFFLVYLMHTATI
jgi:hypothetical protein